MTRVVVINVDIGDVDEIISKKVEEISGESKKILSEAILMQKRIQEEKEKKTAEKKQTTDKAKEIMDQIHDKLEAAIPEGIPVDEIMGMAKDIISTVSAMTMRIKTMLRHREHKYRLIKKKVHRIDRYYFEPFSIEENEED